MNNHSRFVIQNDLSAAVIVNIEPESFEFPLASGEKVTIKDAFEKEPVTLKVESDKGDTIISVWPGDGKITVEKNGVDVMALIDKNAGTDGLGSHASEPVNR